MSERLTECRRVLTVNVNMWIHVNEGEAAQLFHLTKPIIVVPGRQHQVMQSYSRPEGGAKSMAKAFSSCKLNVSTKKSASFYLKKKSLEVSLFFVLQPESHFSIKSTESFFLKNVYILYINMCT